METTDLSEEEIFRGIGIFLAGDRYDIRYSVKECARESAKPAKRAKARLKRIARYLLSWLLKEESPFGVSKVYCIFALAKQAQALCDKKWQVASWHTR